MVLCINHDFCTIALSRPEKYRRAPPHGRSRACPHASSTFRSRAATVSAGKGYPVRPRDPRKRLSGIGPDPERSAEAKIREADRLECEARNAIMWAGGPAMPSPGDPQAEPTIGKAINGGYDLLEAKCNRCDRVSLVPLRALKQPPEVAVWKLERALYCEPCSEGRHYSRRQRAHILRLTYARPDAEPVSAKRSKLM